MRLLHFGFCYGLRWRCKCFLFRFLIINFVSFNIFFFCIRVMSWNWCWKPSSHHGCGVNVFWCHKYTLKHNRLGMITCSLLLQDVQNCHRAACGDADKGRSDMSKKTAETCLSFQGNKRRQIDCEIN